MWASNIIPQLVCNFSVLVQFLIYLNFFPYTLKIMSAPKVMVPLGSQTQQLLFYVAECTAMPCTFHNHTNLLYFSVGPYVIYTWLVVCISHSCADFYTYPKSFSVYHASMSHRNIMSTPTVTVTDSAFIISSYVYSHVLQFAQQYKDFDIISEYYTMYILPYVIYTISILLLGT